MKGKDVVNAWDKIDGYINWCVEWLTLCSKKLKPNGVLYFWHNDMEQIAELLMKIRKRTPLVFVSFCIWDKGEIHTAQRHGTGVIPMAARLCVRGSTPANAVCIPLTLR